MEDDKSTNTSAEETLEETEAEAALENDDVSFDDSDETEESEESTEDEPADESDEETEESETDEGNQSQDEEPKEKDTLSEDEQKKHNAEMAQKRIAEKKAREDEKRKQQEDYLQSAEDPRDMALRQLQIDAYNNRIETNNTKLETGIDRAVASIDLFHNGTPEEKEALADALDDFERMYISRDSNGDPLEVKGDVYDFLVKKADSIKRLTTVGARKGTQAKNQSKARTDTLPTRTPKQAPKDPLLDGFDEEADRW